MPKAAPPIKVPKRATPPAEIPRRIDAPGVDDHLAVLSRAVFQAGLSWSFIATRWDAMCAAFDGFSVQHVAAYGEADTERLMETDGVVHSRAKIAGTIHNAQTLAALVRDFGSVEAYLRQFATYDALFADARKRFAYLGDLNCYYWLFRTGAAVPPLERWMARQPKDHPRMREMVTLAREQGTSSERDEY